MALLMVDGTPIAEIDARTAELLTQIASENTGVLLAPLELSPGRPEVRDIMPLARGTLMMREHQQNYDVSLSLRFSLSNERIENTIAKW